MPFVSGYLPAAAEHVFRPDSVTKAVCEWIRHGMKSGNYSGPLPGLQHGLAPLLSGEMGRPDVRLRTDALWFRLEQAVKPVLDRMADVGVTCWAMKGFDLARSLYPFPGARPMRDADLFVKRNECRQAMLVFRSEGWSEISPGDGIFDAQIVSEIKMVKNGLMVELHTHIFYFPAVFPGKLPVDLFENGRRLTGGLVGFTWHNALLLVIIHMLLNTSLRPVWWVDVFLLCQVVTKQNAWKSFAWNAARTNLGGAIADVLAVSSSELNAPVPQRVITALRQSSTGRESILKKLRAGAKLPTLTNLRYLSGWQRTAWTQVLFWLAISHKRPVRQKKS